VDLPTYTNIWRIEKRLYKLYDLRLPMPLPLVQIGVFIGVFLPWIILLQLLRVPFHAPWHVVYLVPPGVLTWLATRPVIEGKRLTELLISQVRYLSEPRTWARLTPIREPDEVAIVGRVWRRRQAPLGRVHVAGQPVPAAETHAGRPARTAPSLADHAEATASPAAATRPGPVQRPAHAADGRTGHAGSSGRPAHTADRGRDRVAAPARRPAPSLRPTPLEGTGVVSPGASNRPAPPHGRKSTAAPTPIQGVPTQPRADRPAASGRGESARADAAPGPGRQDAAAAPAQDTTAARNAAPGGPERAAPPAAREHPAEAAPGTSPAKDTGPGTGGTSHRLLRPRNTSHEPDEPGTGARQAASAGSSSPPADPAGAPPERPVTSRRPPGGAEPAVTHSPGPRGTAQRSEPATRDDPATPRTQRPSEASRTDQIVWPASARPKPGTRPESPGPRATPPGPFGRTGEQARRQAHGEEPAATRESWPPAPARRPADRQPPAQPGTPVRSTPSPVPAARPPKADASSPGVTRPDAPRQDRGTDRHEATENPAARITPPVQAPRPQGTPPQPPSAPSRPASPRPATRPAAPGRQAGRGDPQATAPESPARDMRSGPASPVRPGPLPAASRDDDGRDDESRGLRKMFSAGGQSGGDYEERIRTALEGARRVVVLGCTGGAGQTVTALMLGHTFAQHRRDRIVAVDVNPGPGAMARRTRTETRETLTSLITHAEQLTGYQMMRRYTSVSKSGLEVVAAGKNPVQALDDRDYALAMRTLDRFYAVTLLDAAAAVVARVLPYADQIVLVAPASSDAPRAVAMTFEWLDGHGYEHLRAKAVTVINGVSRRSMDDVEQAESVARGRCRALVRIPWDDHLSLDRAPRNELRTLRAPTRKAYIALGGVVAGGLVQVPERYPRQEVSR
jgi:MinD-like ATPase involved in chromosome partitioning or flagellar assembly